MQLVEPGRQRFQGRRVQFGQICRQHLGRRVFEADADVNVDERLAHRDVPGQGQGGEHVVEGNAVVAVLEPQPRPQAGQPRQQPRRRTLGEERRDAVLVRQAPGTGGHRRPVVQLVQGPFRPPDHLPHARRQRHGRRPLDDLLLLLLVELRQAGEPPPVFQRGVRVQVGFRLGRALPAGRGAGGQGQRHQRGGGEGKQTWHSFFLLGWGESERGAHGEPRAEYRVGR
jgi:hypothetical protein